MKVLVVGLNPSRQHGDSSTLKTLYKWLDQLGVKTVSFVNLYEDYEINKYNSKINYIKDISGNYDKIISLGKAVSTALSNVDINHFSLPHPSGLNRQLNDKQFVHERLQSCKNYLEAGQ